MTPRVERLPTAIEAGVASSCAADLPPAASLTLNRLELAWQAPGNGRSGRSLTSHRGLAGSRGLGSEALPAVFEEDPIDAPRLAAVAGVVLIVLAFRVRGRRRTTGSRVT